MHYTLTLSHLMKLLNNNNLSSLFVVILSLLFLYSGDVNLIREFIDFTNKQGSSENSYYVLVSDAYILSEILLRGAATHTLRFSKQQYHQQKF